MGQTGTGTLHGDPYNIGQTGTGTLHGDPYNMGQTGTGTLHGHPWNVGQTGTGTLHSDPWNVGRTGSLACVWLHLEVLIQCLCWFVALGVLKSIGLFIAQNILGI
ncbi:hypothetical protein BsWGS_22424 [Bradybaena similaris]